MIYTPKLEPYGIFKAVLLDLDGKILEVQEVHNLVTQVGKNGWAKIANSESGFTGVVNYVALGTGANAPALGDTTLQTEVARTTQVSGSNARLASVVTQEFYFSPAVANVNIKEVGAFVDGTASADTGTLFDRALLDITKTSSNSLYIYFSLTFA